MGDVLFTPFKIGAITIPNRLVRSATSERAASQNGFATDELSAIYRKLGAGGAGLVITGYAYVHPLGRCGGRQTAIWDDRFTPGLTNVAAAFHKATSSGKIFIQLAHGGRQAKAFLVERLVAPSPVPMGEIVPRALKQAEIEEIIKSFASSALVAKEAGFDGIQLHGAHGFLISQFISPFTNHRKDRWGGSRENRWRFFLEILEAVKKATGPAFPVIVKINGSDFMEEKGLNVDECADMLKIAQDLGLDGVEVSGGIADSPPQWATVRPHINSRKEEAYFLPWARTIKKALSIPVITVGGIRSAQVAREIINRGDADAVAMCRPFIREPDLALKFRDGIPKARCVSCQGCLIDTGLPVCCTLREYPGNAINNEK